MINPKSIIFHGLLYPGSGTDALLFASQGFLKKLLAFEITEDDIPTWIKKASTDLYVVRQQVKEYFVLD